MILDNNLQDRKISEFIKKWTDSGKIDIVTGYFTIGALAYFSKTLNQNINSFRFVLGEIVNKDIKEEHSIDLLSETINIETAVKLKKISQEAVDFLKQKKVELKTLEPNFCHAKLYLYKSETDPRHSSYITGSSNLTEAGIGLKDANNIELNTAEDSENGQFDKLCDWFSSLWDRKEAHTKKTIYDVNGKKKEVDFKKYIIDEISKVFKEYSPKELYYKVLYELFQSKLITENDSPEFNNQVTRLRNTKIYHSLYDFQKNGVLSLIKMLRDYNGAILADAVGLGKTWTALAVMKFYQLQGREIILLCPKKLFHNWNRYKQHQNSRFEKDKLNFFIRYHTDLQDTRLDNYSDREDKYFVNDQPKLLVIDESHNLRNAKSSRYKFLIDNILKKNHDIKVLMLSATPINTSLNDIKNQFKIICKGNSNGFYQTHSIRDIDYVFRKAQQEYSQWRSNNGGLNISHFISALPEEFFNLTDSLIVARTRNLVSSQQTNLQFPKKNRPKNIFVTPKKIGNIETFKELLESFPPLLSAYLPSFYVEQEQNIDVINDERQRDKFLVKMMYILLVKRLESSWYSFKTTVQRILDHHQNALDKIIDYEKSRNTNLNFETCINEDIEGFSDLSIGKNRPVSISDIEKYNQIENFKTDLKNDIKNLTVLLSNLEKFQSDIDKELKIVNNKKTIDDKLLSLINEITEKQKKDNKKVLIFTVYKDTAFYLYEQLSKRGFNKIACISGDDFKSDVSNINNSNFEPILERFAPYTKLFIEKEWSFTPSAENMPLTKQYKEWKDWLQDNDNNTYEKVNNQIDILIATDVLSEGQNLQDCDMVINYDIHWNPVRVIQRMGRIDRLGSPNQTVSCINYWAAENIDEYLNLKQRIETRMATMTLAGAEINVDFTDSLAEIASDMNFEDKLNEKMLKQMEDSWDDIETNETSLGCNNFSLEDFRQDLLNELESEKSKYKNMPKAVFTGFNSNDNKTGIIALLGYPARPHKSINHTYKKHELIFINNQGEMNLLNQKEVLDYLSNHKDSERFVPDAINQGDEKAILALTQSLNRYISKQAEQATPNILQNIAQGNIQAINLANNTHLNDFYNHKNIDLITWFLVNN